MGGKIPQNGLESRASTAARLRLGCNGETDSVGVRNCTRPTTVRLSVRAGGGGFLRVLKLGFALGGNTTVLAGKR